MDVKMVEYMGLDICILMSAYLVSKHMCKYGCKHGCRYGFIHGYQYFEFMIKWDQQQRTRFSDIFKFYTYLTHYKQKCLLEIK